MRQRVTRGLRAIRAWCATQAWRRTWMQQVVMPWPVPPPLPEGEEWTKEDAAAVERFWRTPAGARALQALQRLEYDNYTAACNQRQPGTTRDYAAGYASGFRSCAAYLITLSAGRTESDQSADDSSSEAAIRDRYSL